MNDTSSLTRKEILAQRIAEFNARMDSDWEALPAEEKTPEAIAECTRKWDCLLSKKHSRYLKAMLSK